MATVLTKLNANLLMALINCAVTTKAITVTKQSNVLDSLKTDGVSMEKDATSFTFANNIKTKKTNGIQLKEISEKLWSSLEAFQDSSQNDN